MSRNINLYDPRFLKKRDWLAGRSVATLTLAAVALIVVGAVAARWSLLRQESLQKATAGQLQQVRATFAELTQLLSQRKPDPALQQEVKALQADVDLATESQRLLQQMGDGQRLRPGEVLAALARVGNDGLWLTGLSLGEGGQALEIRGRALDQALVPPYLRRLEMDGVFRGRRFAALEMQGGHWTPPADPATPAAPVIASAADASRERWYVEFALRTHPATAEEALRAETRR